MNDALEAAMKRRRMKEGGGAKQADRGDGGEAERNEEQSQTEKRGLSRYKKMMEGAAALSRILPPTH